MTEQIYNLDHIARIEGYGDLFVETKDKKLTKVEMRVREGARFFEGIVLGRKYSEVPITVSRICAICSASHRVVANYAVENALSISVPKQVHDFRDLLVLGEYVQSHTLHFYYLALPDYLGYESVIPAVQTHGEVVKRALVGKKFGNEIQRLIGGRAVHPIRSIVGGFSMYPTIDELKYIRSKIDPLIEDTMKTIALFKTVPGPVLNNEKPNFAVTSGRYEFVKGDLLCSDKSCVKPDHTTKAIIEEVRPYSHTKFATYHGEPVYVGPLPRLNLAHDMLTPKGKEAFEKSGLKLPSTNTFDSSMARLVELVEAAEQMKGILDKYIASGIQKIPVEFTPKPGRGYAITEAPRGLLYHMYEFDNDLRCTKADIITPTAFNQHKMESDARVLVPTIIDTPKDNIMLKLNMMIRAYDPCISCSAHFLHQ